MRSTGWMSAARSGGMRSSQLMASRKRVRPEYSAYSGPSCATISGASDGRRLRRRIDEDVDPRDEAAAAQLDRANRAGIGDRREPGRRFVLRPLDHRLVAERPGGAQRVRRVGDEAAVDADQVLEPVRVRPGKVEPPGAGLPLEARPGPGPRDVLGQHDLGEAAAGDRAASTRPRPHGRVVGSGLLLLGPLCSCADFVFTDAFLSQ